MSASATHLFLHGSGMGAWVWDRVLPHMPGDTLALDLPSLDADLTPRQCAEVLLQDLDRRGAGDIHLILHSLSGVLAGDLGQLLGPRLRSVTYVSAVIAEPGQSFAQARDFPTGLILPVLFAFNKEGIRPSDDMLRKAYGNDLDAADIQLVIDRCRRDRPSMDLTRIEAAVPDVPSVYVRTLRDHALTPKEQAHMIARLTAARVVDIDAGHMVMLSQPQILAQALTEAIKVEAV